MIESIDFEQSFFVDGNYLGKCKRKTIQLNLGFQQTPMAFCIVCPKCARTWAVCNVVPRLEEMYRVRTIPCRDCTSTLLQIKGLVELPDDERHEVELPLELWKWNLNRWCDWWETRHDNND